MSTPSSPPVSQEVSAHDGIRDHDVHAEKRTTFTQIHDFGFIPIPQHLRYDPNKPFHFSLLLNITFGIAATLVVSNLYYCQPLLVKLADEFGVTYSDVSRIPTLVQAGYATGIVLISPLGDLLRRRQVILAIVTLSASFTVGVAVTSSLIVFEILSFLIGTVSVTAQILIPLAADLSPTHRRAGAISIVLSGLLFGILIARVFAGIIAEFASYRVVYYYAIGVQIVVLFGGYFMLPDYPPKNAHLTYFHILWTMLQLGVTEPTLIQGSLILLCSSACFSNFWVTLTFLLNAEPYRYSTLVIGLFGLIGIAGVAAAPIVGRLVDRLVPWYATLFSIVMLLVFQSIQVGAGGIHVAAVIVAAFGLDVFSQMIQVSVSVAIFGISASARARLNAVLVLSIFLGQVMGTSAGTYVFINHGWRASAVFALALFGVMLMLLFLRGPHVGQYTWFGYEGGLETRKAAVEKQKHLREQT